jgi:hypothetical protein
MIRALALAILMMIPSMTYAQFNIEKTITLVQPK